jgi:type VI secretion system secreted protein Hcp
MSFKSFIAVAIAIFTVTLFSAADGALNAYMSVKGQKQGLFKGGVIQKGREGKIGVIAMSHEIVSPRDAASGLPTGKVQHKPLTVTVEWDSAIFQFYNALFANETLSEVTIDFFAPSMLGQVGGAGAEVNFVTVNLTNASIASIRSQQPNTKDPNQVRYKEYLEVSFTYQKIEVKNNINKGIAIGNWQGLPGLGAEEEEGSLLLKAAKL